MKLVKLTTHKFLGAALIAFTGTQLALVTWLVIGNTTPDELKAQFQRLIGEAPTPVINHLVPQLVEPSVPVEAESSVQPGQAVSQNETQGEGAVTSTPEASEQVVGAENALTQESQPEAQQAEAAKTDLAVETYESLESAEEKFSQPKEAGSDSYDGLLKEAFSAVEEELANPTEDDPALFSELRLTKQQAWKLVQMHQRLRRDIKRAEERGATGLRRMLINDHISWAREFLGRDNFIRYSEMSQDIMRPELSRADVVTSRSNSGS